MIKEVFLEWTVKVFAVWCEARGNIASCGVDLSVNFDLPFWIPKTTHIISWNIHDYDIYCINNIIIYQLIYSVYIYISSYYMVAGDSWKYAAQRQRSKAWPPRLHCTAILVLSRNYVGTLVEQTKLVIWWSFLFCSGRLNGWTHVVLHHPSLNQMSKKVDAEMLRLSRNNPNLRFRWGPCKFGGANASAGSQLACDVYQRINV